MQLLPSSAVLTLIAVLATMWMAGESWRPTPLLASADRPKFPFGGKRREPEPEPSGPDLLDEVAGGRYGGGQTMLPALGAPGEPRPERKLPRLFPDPQSPSEIVDDSGFDDDLIDWSPAAPVDAAPATAPRPQNPGDPGWPRDMGLLEAIANMPESTPDTDDLWGTAPDPWASFGAPAAPQAEMDLPLDPAPRPSFGDAPASWDRPVPEPDAWPSAPSEPIAEAEPDADSWHSWQWQTEARPEPADDAVAHIDAPEVEAPEDRWSIDPWSTPPAATLTWDTAPVATGEDPRPFAWSDGSPAATLDLPPAPPVGATTASESAGWFDDHADDAAAPLPVREPHRSSVPEIDGTDHWFSPLPASPSAADEPRFDRDALLGADEPAAEAELGAGPLDAVSVVADERAAAWAADEHLAGAHDEADEAGDPFGAGPSSESAAPSGSPLEMEAFGASEETDPWSDDPLVAHDPFGVAATVVSVPLGADEAADRAPGDSWSDLYSIFGGDEGPADAPATEPFPHEAPAAVRPAPAGDQWASSLLDRLRSVVATPAEPAEALDEFDARFGRGLRLRLTDQQVMQYLGQGVHLVAPEAEVQVLLAADGQEFVEAGTERHRSRAACGVEHADLCPAVVQDETLTFENSNDLDACPYLSDRPTGACAAVCVPLGTPGEARGVVHITTLRNATLPEATVTALEGAAALVSTRLVELRIARERRRAGSSAD